MRFAPSDCRMASSRRRDTNRTSVSVATFALVSNSTTAAKASRMGSVAAMYPLAPNGIQRDPVIAQMIVRKRRDNIVHHGVEVLGCQATAHAGPQSSYYVQPDRTTTAMRHPPHIRP